jgi:hypothetical protein
MERLIMVNKISLIVLILISSISCKSLFDSNKKTLRDRIFMLSSVLDDDRCTLIMNDSVYLLNTPIKTNRALGIDLTNELVVDSISNPVKFEIIFEGNISYDGKAFPIQLREIRLDTILDLRHGKYVLINARIDKILISQSKKKLNLS